MNFIFQFFQTNLTRFLREVKLLSDQQHYAFYERKLKKLKSVKRDIFIEFLKIGYNIPESLIMTDEAFKITCETILSDYEAVMLINDLKNNNVSLAENKPS